MINARKPWYKFVQSEEFVLSEKDGRVGLKEIPCNPVEVTSLRRDYVHRQYFLQYQIIISTQAVTATVFQIFCIFRDYKYLDVFNYHLFK